MSNAFFDNVRNLVVGDAAAAHTLPVFETATLKAHLVDAADYTLSTATHQDEADITNAGLMTAGGTSTLANITGGAVGVGVIDCDDILWTSVTGDQAEYIIVWEDTGGADTTDPLICVFDTTNTGLPVTPSGGNITAIVNSSGLFSF